MPVCIRPWPGLWPFVGELTQADEIDAMAIKQGYGADLAVVEDEAATTYRRVFGLAGLALESDITVRSGGKKGLHSEALGYILAEMQSLHRAHPGAVW